MKKQYLAQVKFKGHNPSIWYNASFMMGKSRYCHSVREAREAIEEVKSRHSLKSTIEYQVASILGVNLTDAKTADDMSVVNCRIKERKVTKWKVC